MAWPVNARTSAMMDEAQSLYGGAITATQGSPSTSVSASAGTHAGEGVIDVVGADLDAIVIAMRQVGFAAWHRTTEQGFSPHVHGVAVGEPLLSPQAANQVSAYFAGLNGLANNGPDDGPRDWVGVTWETYTGGTPLPSGSRPTGVPFPGERLPLDDCNALVGAPALTGSTNLYGAITFRDDWGGVKYATLTAGTTVLGIAAREGTYLGDDDVVEFAWVIRYRGTATFTLYDDTDPAWAYSLPTNNLGSHSVSSVDFTEVLVETTSPNVASILAWDGQRVAVEVTSGSIDIDVICLQVYPPGGLPIGDYGGTVAASVEEGTLALGVNQATFAAAADATGGPSMTFADSHADAQAELLSADPVDVTTAAHEVTGGEIFSFQTAGLWAMRSYVQTQSANILGAIPFPSGVDGVDFIRRPDRTVYDWDAYLNFTDDYPSVVGWNHEYISLYRHVGVADDGEVQAYVTDVDVVNTGDAVVAGLSILFGARATVDSVVDPMTSGYDPTSFPVLMPVQDSFAITYVASVAIGGSPSAPWGDSPAHGAQPLIFLGESDFSTYWNKLAPQVGIPPHLLWTPGRWPAGVPDDPDRNVTWLRQRQRNDGLGNSITRARGASSRQISLRQRGYR